VSIGRLIVRMCLAAALAAGAGAALLWFQPDWLLDWLARRYPGCLYRVAQERSFVALTLDDGPDSTTPLILDELRRHSARATFFLISSEVAGREAVVQRIVSEGHELGNHGTRDRAAILLPDDEFVRDITEARRTLGRFGPVRWARPGSGWYSQEMVHALARTGHRCALGSVYPFDAAIPSTRFAGRHILANIRPGAVIVLHDGPARGRRTLAVLQEVLPELGARGYRVVTLSELSRLPSPSRRQRNVPGLTS
jgi:peptidoglycan/xylan/chitin deacetylase (PgdA/CDA1 family)